MTSPEDKCAKCGHERRFHPTREGVRCWRSTKTAYKDVNGDSEYRECDCTGFLDTMTELERVEEIRIRAKDAIRQEYAMGIGPSVATAGKDLAWLCDIARKALEENAELRERRDDLHNDRGESLNACFRYQNQIKALRTEINDALRQYSDRVDWLENRVNELLTQIESERKEYRDAANEGARRFREENADLRRRLAEWEEQAIEFARIIDKRGGE